MILTGTGDSFMDKIDGASLGEIFKPLHWESALRIDGATVLSAEPYDGSTGGLLLAFATAVGTLMHSWLTLTRVAA